MADYSRLPPDVVLFGPDGNCTLEICPIEASLYGYRPSLSASISFIVLYALSACIHIYLGWRWKKWFFMSCMVLGALNAIAGYAGRIILYNNPFDFTGFMLQIVCITSGPVYFTAAIYVSLAATIQYFAPEISRFRPRLYYWIFIPGDLICLVIQAAGGAMSTTSKGANQTGVDLALAGLVLQVVFMLIFCALFGDYLIRYARASRAVGGPKFTRRLGLFFGFIATATLLILTRCAYRLAELHEGYGGKLVRDEGLFIGLEGVMIIIAVYCLMVGHPGLVFGNGKHAGEDSINYDSQTSEQKPYTAGS
ncbi:parasitic phase-specific protein psp-1 [Diaporthe amygdali]|uniref:parasitic phase-specific protein psp-1 n=1 Tax=Phomopsis amygdali TaxID=1214568 RepID=UPI0022FDE0F8|nr:parasitic phase-specific protein psp-1 [Diaporthe amygdali]KAJ0123206.1 parasitic phase-specific protein psp-1 [Diaporthe amygdali]